MDYKTALNQLTFSNNGFGVLKFFIGAYDFVKFEPVGKNHSIRFKFEIGGKKNSNYCRLIYDYARDLYNMEFKLLNDDKETEKTKLFEGLFFDQLKEFFETYTGLYLSFN